MKRVPWVPLVGGCFLVGLLVPLIICFNLFWGRIEYDYTLINPSREQVYELVESIYVSDMYVLKIEQDGTSIYIQIDAKINGGGEAVDVLLGRLNIDYLQGREIK